MNTLKDYIYEAYATKKQLSEFEQCWFDWLQEHGKEGKLPKSNKDIKTEMLNFVNRNYDYEIDRFDSDPYYTTLQDMAKCIYKKQDWFNIDSEIIKSKSKLYKFLHKRVDEEYLSSVMRSLVKHEYKSDWNEWFNEYLMNTLFCDIYKYSKFDSRGLIKIVRSVSIPKNSFKNKVYTTYKEWIDNYFDGLGVYWSFNQGGVYCFQTFDDDKLIDAGNSVTLDIYAYAPLSSIDMGSTFRQLSGGFDSEQEITIISGEPVEVYQIIVKEGNIKAKLPLKKSIICNA